MDWRVKVNGHLQVKVCSSLGGLKQDRPDRHRCLSMEHPEAAAEAEAGLGEVLSRQQQR